jgi:Zn-dependent protease
MTRTLSLGTIFNIPLRLHYSWFLALVSVAAGMIFYYHGTYTWWQGALYGVAAVMLFFMCMFVRALLTRILVPRAFRVQVKSLTLCFYGGIPRIKEEETRLGSEFLMAAVGPVVSLVLAAIFYLSFSITSIDEVTATAEILQWLYYVNVMIALFNLIPAYPLDGGRFLRAILWAASRDLNRATRITSLMGFIIGLLLIISGLVAILWLSQWFTGPILIFAGWLLQEAAWAMRRRARVRNALRGLDAGYLLSDDYTPLKEQLTFAVVRDYIINSGQRCFMVLVGELMAPRGKLKTAKPAEPIASLLELMEECDISQIPILEEGKLIGMVTRERVLRFLQARAVLRI